MQISALNPTAASGLASTESQSQAASAEPVESAQPTQAVGPGEAVVADVTDYHELLGAHALDPARVAALLADPFED